MVLRCRAWGRCLRACCLIGIFSSQVGSSFLTGHSNPCRVKGRVSTGGGKVGRGTETRVHGRVQAAVRSVCYSRVLGERRGFERASCSCSEACSCVAAEVSSVGAGSDWVFLSGERVIAPTILSLLESLRARLVVWSLALSLCRNRRRRESVRAARGCAVQ